MLDHDDVLAAAGRLAGVAHRTPVVTSRALDEMTGATVFLKAENLQRTGSFKLRGAFNAISVLDESTRRAGIVTHSSGNHGQAVAFAAAHHGVPATVVMPSDAPSVKKAAVRGYGADIVEYDRATGAREEISADIAATTGGTVIPPYDHWPIMAGQGTAALELFDEVGDLDVLLVCTGGGGLLAGSATVARHRSDSIEIYGVEPEASDDTRRSLAAGHIVTIPQPVTIADGQALRAPGEKTFAVNSKLVTDVVTVSDVEIVEAMRVVFDRLRLVVEPSGASALAALLAGRIEAEGRRIGVTLSGGNVDRAVFARLLTHGVDPAGTDDG